MDTKNRLSNWFLLRHGTVMSFAYANAPLPDTINDIYQASYVEFLDETRHWSEVECDDEVRLMKTLRAVVRRVAQRIWREHHRNTPENLRKIHLKIAELGRAREASLRFEDEYGALHHCIEKLPEKSRILIEQRYFMDHSASSIARRFNVSPVAVFQAIARIREALERCIKRFYLEN